MKIYKIAWEGANSVRDPAKTLSIREIGKNIPIEPIRLTFWIEEAEKWLQELGGSKTHEIVSVVITPYKK
jgi:hypothetical protein